MNRSGAGLLMLVILFTVWTNPAIRTVTERNGNPAEPPQNKEPEPKSVRSPQPWLDDALSKYSDEFQRTLKGFYLDKSDGETGAWSCPAPSTDKLLTQLKKESAEAVLAIVPDPVHTHLSLFFDRQIDAIRQAAQDKGYYFDRAIMPWDSKDHTESADLNLRLQQELYHRCTEKHPGLMIFRPPSDGGKDQQNTKKQQTNHRVSRRPDEDSVERDLHHGALLVFVVGESPTSGIRKDQFEEAVADIWTLLRNDRPRACLPTLRILGPTFSGSLYSLQGLIETNQNRFSEFRVYSGTANSYESTEKFRQFLASLNHRGTFASFQESAELQELLFVRFLLGRGYTTGQIAILSEDQTAYGAFGQNWSNSTPEIQEKACCLLGCPVNTGYEQIQKSLVHVYFPREIAQLRSAYQQELTAPRNGSSEKESFRSTLKRNLADTGSDDDSVQTYSHRQLPLSQESVLLGIVTTLHKHAVEFVIVRATDPLDTVFLARYLRSDSPNLRIVTSGNDLLLRREIEDRVLFGILSINTYSMRPGADDWLPNPSLWLVHQERVFPGPDSVGTYNAMTALLSPDETAEGIKDQCKPIDPADKRICFGSSVRLQEYGWPSLGGRLESGTSNAPPVWVTVLGRDGFWPVALLTPSDNPNDPKEPVSRLPLLEQRLVPPRERPQPPATWAWRALCAFTMAVAIVYICLLGSGKTLSVSQVSQQLAVRAPDCRLPAFAIQGFLLTAVVSLVWWPWLHARVEGCWLWRIALGITAPALLGFVVYDLLQRSKNNRTAGRFVAVVLLFAIFAGGTIWALFRSPKNDAITNVFIYRYVHMAWWVSALLPVLLVIAAGLWWSWYTIQGATLLDDRTPPLPKTQSQCKNGVPANAPPPCPMTKSGAPPGGALPLEFTRLSKDERDVQDLIDTLTPSKWNIRVHLPVIGFVVLAFSLIGYCHAVPSVEDQWYDLFFGILLLGMLCALFSSLLRLCFIWMHTKRLLIRLDGTRLRYGFSRLPGYAWMPFWGLGTSPLPDRERLARLEVEALQTFVSTVEESKKQVFDDLQNKVRGAVDNLQKALDRKPLKEIKSFYDEIASAAGAVLQYLSEKWQNEEYDEHWGTKGRKETELHCVSYCHPATEESTSAKSKSATKAAEDFVALVYASFFQMVLLRLRCLIICACGMFVFIVASFNVYPFGPKAWLNSLSIFLLLVIVGVIVLVFSQIRRDATLSHITDTTAGQLGADFWLKLAQFGALPLLSLLTSLYPEVGSFLFSWLEPVVQALGR